MGQVADAPGLGECEPAAYDAYVARYLRFFREGCLSGLRVGLYEHSSVAREFYAYCRSRAPRSSASGSLSRTYLRVNTEAIRPEDVDSAGEWAGSAAVTMPWYRPMAMVTGR